MARFLAAIEGQSGNEVHRLGSPRSGIRAQAQGWDTGVKVYGNPKPLDEERDMFKVYAFGGSNNGGGSFMLGTVQRSHSGEMLFTLSDELAAQLHPQYQTAVIA